MTKSRNQSKRSGPLQGRETRALEGAALATIAILIVILFAVSALQTLVVRSGQGAAVVSAVLVDLANNDRAAESRPSLRINPVLVAAAQAKANDMAAKSYFSHDSPDGKDSWYWFKEAGYSFTYAGENLAVDFSDSADVERAWMNSPTHRDNLLDPKFTEIGIALAEGTYNGRATTFVVQMFGAPAGASEVSALIQEIATSQDATEPALATTIQEPANVLGASAQEQAHTEPVAAVQTDKTPIGAVLAPSKAGRYAPAWGFLATSPKTTLRYAYYLVGFIVLMALLITTGLELRWHHARAFTVAACLLVFMSGLFVVADVAIFSEPVLADSTNSPHADETSLE